MMVKYIIMWHDDHIHVIEHDTGELGSLIVRELRLWITLIIIIF